MFSKFNYTPGSLSSYKNERYFRLGSELYTDIERESRKCLSTFIKDNGQINGSALKEHWFSISQKDIFISHSHKDLDDVKAFAGWIKNTFDLDCFIDSCAWGYCNDLLKEIDDRYCRNDNSTSYSYKLRNYTTSHVHMMLSTALSEMIDKCECVIFFNTPHSVNMENDLRKIRENEKDAITLSPWIFHELSMTTMIKQTTPERLVQKPILKHRDEKLFEFCDFSPEYDVTYPIKEMKELMDQDLQNWQNKYNNNYNGNALDVLYNIKHII